jgi:hypothetical protein
MELKENIDFDDLAKFLLEQEIYLISPNIGVYQFQYKSKLYGFSLLGKKICRTHSVVVDTQADEHGQFKVEKDFWDWSSSLVN